MSKLGAVEITDRVKAGLKCYERLEGARKADKLIEEASNAYLKVITSVIAKDAAIQTELAKEKSSRRTAAAKLAAVAS